MAPLQTDQPVAITLTALEWNAVLVALHEAPYRIAAPIIQKIVAQAQPPPAETNGEAEARLAA
jgi:hypothetical protein